MIKKETGFFRRNWNYFKRGKNEINFLLNIYQTLVLIWGIDALTKSGSDLIYVTFWFGLFIFGASLIIGQYSLKKVDTSLAYINPFTQDIVLYRKYISIGLMGLMNDNKNFAYDSFRKANEILERWIK